MKEATWVLSARVKGEPDRTVPVDHVEGVYSRFPCRMTGKSIAEKIGYAMAREKSTKKKAQPLAFWIDEAGTIHRKAFAEASKKKKWICFDDWKKQ